MSVGPDKSRLAEYGEPTWDIARLFPRQGTWTAAEYVAMDTNQLVGFSNGFVEVLPTPTLTHQLVAGLPVRLLAAYVEPNRLGTVVAAPYKVRLEEGRYREPDVVFMRAGHEFRLSEQFALGADLVMEVVSEGDENRIRDLVAKRAEYAAAGIPEYWIVDPEQGQITVLTLDGATYTVHGEFSRGQQATSKLLPGFAVDVTSALAPKRVGG